jgi:hypothetical protein
LNYVPVNGLRVLLIEISILLGTFLAALLLIRFAGPLARLRWFRSFLARNWCSVGFVIAVALLGRALLLPVIGIPEPRINDEYSYLLMGDTFAHHRLTNPTPSAWQHFETFHVTLVPTYHSKYPVAQGIVLGFGQALFHRPWTGVFLNTALMCGAICWALQAFVSPAWALLGGLLVVARLALFSYWMNSYWGGSVAALGGAVALGSVVRLFNTKSSGRDRVILSCTFAIGLLILSTSRPYEGLAFSLPLIGYFCYHALKEGVRNRMVAQTMLPVLSIGVAGLLWMGYYNHRTTGSATLLPYVLNERTYSPLPFLIPQKLRSGITPSDPVFEKYYQVEAEEHEFQKTKTVSGLTTIELGRAAITWFFYVGPALLIPVAVGLVSCAKRGDMRIAVFAAVTTYIAVALCNWTQPHYFSPATVVVYLCAAEGLRYFWDTHENGERAFVVAVCLTVAAASLARETGSAVWSMKYRFLNQRKAIAEQLEMQPGKQLVLVSYDMERHYPGNELVHNGAEFSSEKILWARDKGLEKDQDLCDAYPDRTFWIVVTDDVKLELTAIDLCKLHQVQRPLDVPRSKQRRSSLESSRMRGLIRFSRSVATLR